MKTFISIFVVTLALAFTGPAFAGDVKNAKSEQDCVRDGGTWNDTTKNLLHEQDVRPLSLAHYERELALVVALFGPLQYLKRM